MAIMPDDPNPFELDLDGVYERYLKTCAMSGVEPVSRERVLGLVREWTEVLSGRPEPTAHWKQIPLSAPSSLSCGGEADVVASCSSTTSRHSVGLRASNEQEGPARLTSVNPRHFAWASNREIEGSRGKRARGILKTNVLGTLVRIMWGKNECLAAYVREIHRWQHAAHCVRL